MLRLPMSLSSDQLLPDLPLPSPKPELDPQPPCNHKISVVIEVALDHRSTSRFDSVEKHVELYLRENYRSLAVSSRIEKFEKCMSFLDANVQSINVVECIDSDLEIIRLDNAVLDIHVYQLQEEVNRLCVDSCLDEGESGEGTSFALATDLPAKVLGLWESLVFDSGLKSYLLRFMASIMLFSDHEVNPQIISIQRLVLLHGPPGSGKTSLCKVLALAHKICIRFSTRFSAGKLVEVSAPTLFSRYFSESSKLVVKLCEKIHELAEDKDTLICVLIDEIESLTSARKSAVSGSDPGDAMRVVNVLLTQLDRLKSMKNILILTTSNMLQASDPAFLDRADLIQHIGYPGPSAIYCILRSCLLELTRSGLIESGPPHQQIPVYHEAQVKSVSAQPRLVSMLLQISQHLASRLNLGTKEMDNSDSSADRFVPISGRGLRRLPLLAFAKYIKHTRDSRPRTMEDVLDALLLTALDMSA